MATRLRGRWALGITPRNFTWILKDKLAICERPGGYGENHRRVRRQEEIIWIRENGFGCVISIIPAPHNLHNYDELGVTSRHRPFNGDELETWLRAFYRELHELLRNGTKVIVHGEEVGDRIVGIMGGYIRWAGLVDDDTQAITVTERLAGRQLDPFARNVILNAPSCADAGRPARQLAIPLERGIASARAVVPRGLDGRPGRRVLVSGMGGDLGSRVAAPLEDEAWVGELVGLDVDPPRRRIIGRRSISCRRSITTASSRLITAFNPHVVVHIAVWEPFSRANPATARQLTDDAATSILGAAAECRALESVIVRSGIEIYGRARGRRPGPTSPPTSTRRATTATCSPASSAPPTAIGRRIGVTVGAIRMGTVLGPHVPSPLGRVLRMPAVPFSVLADPPFAVVEDTEVRQAFVAAAQRRLAEPVNVVANGAITALQAPRRGRRIPIPLVGPDWRIASSSAACSARRSPTTSSRRAPRSPRRQRPDGRAARLHAGDDDRRGHRQAVRLAHGRPQPPARQGGLMGDVIELIRSTTCLLDAGPVAAASGRRRPAAIESPVAAWDVDDWGRDRRSSRRRPARPAALDDRHRRRRAAARPRGRLIVVNARRYASPGVAVALTASTGPAGALRRTSRCRPDRRPGPPPRRPARPARRGRRRPARRRAARARLLADVPPRRSARAIHGSSAPPSRRAACSRRPSRRRPSRRAHRDRPGGRPRRRRRGPLIELELADQLETASSACSRSSAARRPAHRSTGCRERDGRGRTDVSYVHAPTTGRIHYQVTGRRRRRRCC